MRYLIRIIMAVIFASSFFISCQAATSPDSIINVLDLYPFNSPAQQDRFQELNQQLRCLVCQNQTLAESNAPLAKDLRFEIYRLIKQGKSDHQIIKYLVSHYGDFISFRPPVNKLTYLLWFGPFFILIIVLFKFYLWLRKRKRPIYPSTFSAKDRERIKHLLSQY